MLDIRTLSVGLTVFRTEVQHKVQGAGSLRFPPLCLFLPRSASLASVQEIPVSLELPTSLCTRA